MTGTQATTWTSCWLCGRRPTGSPDADAERIRQTIVPEDLALPATWWSDFNSKVSEAIARATAMPAPAVATWT